MLVGINPTPLSLEYLAAKLAEDIFGLGLLSDSYDLVGLAIGDEGNPEGFGMASGPVAGTVGPLYRFAGGCGNEAIDTDRFGSAGLGAFAEPSEGARGNPEPGIRPKLAGDARPGVVGSSDVRRRFCCDCFTARVFGSAGRAEVGG